MEHYCDASSRAVGDADLKDLCVKYLVKGFLGREIKLFPRNNWYGLHSSLDGVGIFLCVHQLFWLTFASAFGYARVHDLELAMPMLAERAVG